MATKAIGTKYTKKPTGLSISRDNNKFKFAWKIGDTKYDAGQWIRYKVNNGIFTGWGKIGATVTSYTIQPSGAPGNIKRVEFQVKGKLNKTQFKNMGNQIVQIKWVTSEAASCVWTSAKPNRPTLSYSKGSENSGTFSWSVSTDAKDKKIFNNVEFQTWTTNSSNTNPPKNVTSSSKSANGSVSYTESFSGKNIVRCVRVRSRGPAGNSDWRFTYRAYGNPAVPTLKTATATRTNSNSITLRAEWTCTATILNPVDTISIQYLIAVPTNTSLSAPGTGWTDALTITSNGKGDKAAVLISENLETDECLWMRIKSKHDDYEKYSIAKLAMTGTLAKPGFNANPNFSTGSVALTVTENTDCNVACTAIFFRPEKAASKDRIVAIFPRGTTTGTVTVPDIIGKNKSCFGAYAFVGTYSGTTINTAPMKSDAAIDSDIAAVAPAWLTLSAGPQEKSVRVNWPWSWASATSAEVSWANHSDAWESTDQPKTFVIDSIAKSWVVAGLDVGQWYFRVRLKGMIDTDEVTGPWSATYSYNISGQPDRPALFLNKSIINAGQMVTARWAYSSSDNTRQRDAEICLATIASDGTVTYGSVIARTSTAQMINISRNWGVGQTYYLCLRVTSMAGGQSDWSEPVSLTVAPVVTISVQHNLTNVSGTLTLRDMPLTATVTGAGVSGTTAVSIIRAEDYHVYRPDDSEFDGFEGETIATKRQFGEAAMSISPDDLIGHLDDGAKYILRCTVIDTYEQTISQEYPFTVAWTHQSGKPNAKVKIDARQRIAMITPIAPTNYAAGDVCDIYRISIDKPELVVQGAIFGQTYVDPYPAFGDFCGHRIVTRTANGDYITANNELAWILCDAEMGDILEEDSMIIDVAGEQIELPYEIELQNAWTKDFKRTTYLGGAVQGDWNPAVTRDTTANTVIVRGQDLDKQIAMRNLAGYAGIAHVRTPDGSSMACDVQVRENSSYQNKRVTYSLAIKVIDPPAPEGMLLSEWTTMNPPR